MGKIYDALKKAEQEAKIKRGEPASIAAASPDLEKKQAELDKDTREMSAAQQRAVKIMDGAGDANKHLTLQVLPEGKADINKRVVAPFTYQTAPLRKEKLAAARRPPVALITISAPQSAEAEQFRILKSRILSFCKDKEVRTLLVTSCLPEEGKSTVASNLSVCIANGVNEHALLMDCDLRRPSIHRIFNDNTHHTGLADYLAQDLPLQKIMHKTVIDKLAIIPAGSTPTNPSELLSSNKMIDLLKELKSRYSDRYTIIDSTPAYQTPEPVILSRYVDGVILVVRAGKTGRDIVARVAESLGKKNIIGVVFNMVQAPIRSYYYNYNSYYSKKTDD